MNAELAAKLGAIAQTPVLLVAADYDGTLAPIVPDPSAAAPDPRSVAALMQAAGLPHTHGSIISGRAAADLGRLAVGVSPERILMVGLHGVQWPETALVLSQAQQELLARLAIEARAMADSTPGAVVELKPAGVALHYRNVPDAAARDLVPRILAGPGAIEGVHVRHGSRVVELMVLAASKGLALAEARHRFGATGVLFVGDDLTDEDAFAALTSADLGIHVGEGETVATFRIGDTAAVAGVLEEIVRLRAEWLAARNLVPLERCAVLSDQRSIAVVSPGGRLSWLALPRVDSSALFAELVGGPAAGFFTVEPAQSDLGPGVPSYDGDSFTLVTEWPGLRVLDCLDCTGGRAFQKAGRSDLLRRIEGKVSARVLFAPRLDFGRLPTRLIARENGLEVEGSNEPIVLFSPGISWRIIEDGPNQTAEAIIEPAQLPVTLELRYGSASLRPHPETTQDRFAQNRGFWAGWARALRLPAAAPEIVKRSALVLKALSHGPTGAIVAAATTSLPEHLGGVRNWDYRFCWPRDASIIAAAMVRLGNTGHALRFLDWMLGVVDRIESPERLRPIYTVGGSQLPPEAEIGQLAGFGGSRPVRISNGAASQVQLDVFGPIVDLVAMLAERGAPVAPDHWRLVKAMVRAVELRWQEPDHGIWEMRIERRHHVHSKTMCWHTVQRALVVEEAVYGKQNPDWVRLRDAIRADVLANGWNERLGDGGAFTGCYGMDYLDTATLMVGLTGLVSPDDGRFARTVEAVNRGLRRGPTVYRYLSHDGLPGAEGGMHICTGWLIESLALIGRVDEARALFEQLLALVRAPGIMTEQYEPRYGLALGNLAQGYSHAAVINAAVALSAPQRPT